MVLEFSGRRRSLKVGLMVEGGIDEEILPYLIQQLYETTGSSRKDELLYHPMPIPPNGAGEIPKNLNLLIQLYRIDSERRRLGCELFIVVHDSRKTEIIQKEIKTILHDAPDFPAVYGLAIQETEAWILGDIDNVNRQLFKINPLPALPMAPEKDPDPKRTLTNLYIKRSNAIDYDSWNKECARAIAPLLKQKTIVFNCRKGFGKFARAFQSEAKKLYKGLSNV